MGSYLHKMQPNIPKTFKLSAAYINDTKTMFFFFMQLLVFSMFSCAACLIGVQFHMHPCNLAWILFDHVFFF